MSRPAPLPTCRRLLAVLLAATALAARAEGPAAPMLRAEPGSGFTVRPLWTVGERIGDYQPPGVPDGLAVFPWAPGTVRVFMNHELAADAGYPWRLANGTELAGARISYLDLDAATLAVRGAGPAIRAVQDRQGRPVTAAAQVNERPASDPRSARAGFDALCSAQGYRRGQYGFADDIFFTGEEASAREGHPHGGSLWALDVRDGTLWALPALGRGSWENVTAVTPPDADRPDGHVALLLGDDLEFGSAPLYLWVGRKNPAGNFPDRNGLVRGRLYVWVASSGDRSPAQWRGSGSRREGRFLPITARDLIRAGSRGYDRSGYLDDTTLRGLADARGAFRFSRPEDLHTDPRNGTEAVFASTGHGDVFPADEWGDLYRVSVRFAPGAGGEPEPSATLTLVYDSDERGDAGLRNPDNLAWAVDGRVYVQEDKAVKRATFGATGGEAGIWVLPPDGPPEAARRIARVDRTAVPAGSTDAKAREVGAWESSGIVDASPALGAWPQRLALLATVQAHSVTDGAIGGRDALVQAGQLLLLEKPAR